MSITMHEQIEALRGVHGVTLVYCNAPDFDAVSQIGDEPCVAFNLERNDRTITLIMPDTYWQNNPFTSDAAKHISDWLDFMDDKDIKTQTFFYRVSENRFVRLKGTFKILDEDLPENAKKLADIYASVDHVVGVKVRKIVDYKMTEETYCTESLQFYCIIDIKTGQSGPAGEPHINMYCPKNIWDNPEEHTHQAERLAEQVKIREVNSKRLFG